VELAVVVARSFSLLSRIGLAAVALLAISMRGALAGPPFLTDDPEPTDTGHFEDYLHSDATRAGGATFGTAVGLEINYGAFADTQISADLPLGYQTERHDSTRFGLGDATLGVKYRFIEEDDAGWRPQVSFYPSIEIPLAPSAGRNTREFFPLWAQKSFGDWTTFGGGGYWNNPGAGNRDYWFCGWALLRKMSPDFSMGAEIFHQTADKTGGKTGTGAGVGALYDLSENFHLVGSYDAGVRNARATDRYSYYFALEWTK
jgi:hypothetical protein